MGRPLQHPLRWPRLLVICLLAFAGEFTAGATWAAAQVSTLPEGVPDFSADPSRTTVTTAQSGSWSSASTWQGGQVPTSSHVVRILQAHTVTIDDTAAAAYTVAVDGTLAFSPVVNTRLTVTNLQVMAGSDGMGLPGVLQLGTELDPIDPAVKAEIVIANSPLGGGVADPGQFGTGVIVFGKVVMHGSARTPTFGRLAVEPLAGHTTLTFAVPVSGWLAGDRLVLPDTRHILETETVAGGWTNLVNQWEELTVQSVSADGLTVTLAGPLQFNHFGARDFAGALEFLPHAGNLTRNVVVRSANPLGTRGHMLAIHMADVDIRNALFKDLGRTTYMPLNDVTNHIGRYPIHMHHVSGPVTTPDNGFQFTLKGNAVDGGSLVTKFKWGVAVHGSHYGLIQDNVVYNYNGASFATEDGSESFNIFDHNFAIRGMGQPNDEVSEARMAMGTEGVGFWFRGPNNYVTNNVAANFQNPSTEAAYGFVYQFRFLGNIEVPNFKGADTMGTMGPGQSTTMNGNHLPLLQFENNEAYGAMQGGFTYWWISSMDPAPSPNPLESVVRNFTAWHIFNKAVYIYPGQKVTFDGLKIRGNYTAASRCCGDGVYFADYMAKDIVIRNSDIQGMLKGIVAPESGFGPAPNLLVENSFLRNWRNVLVPTVGSVNGCWMDDKLVVLSNTLFAAAPGQPAVDINMVRDVANAPECLAKLDEVRVYAFNGNAADNFQVYHLDADVLPRPPPECTPVTRPGITGLTCTIAPFSTVPTATLNASPATIALGQSATLTWNTTNAASVSIDQGVGFVADSGTRVVSPVATTTYTVTALGETGSVTSSATVTVRTAPPITWMPPANLTYGTPLGAGQLNASTGVAGTFIYTPAAGTVLPVGTAQTLSVTFLPADTANYIASNATVPITVVKATPIISWSAPGSIVVGTALGATQLNATVASPPGALVYTPATGTILPVGPAQRLSVTFTPTDTVNYSTVSAAVPITVVGAGSTPAAPVKIGNLIAGTFNDATGHSGQSHLVYAPNAGRWWLFTLSSAHDSLGDRTVQSYVSSGPDLAIATWTAATVSPTLANANGATSSLLAGGRSLGVALRTIGTTDYVHLFASSAFDGQTSSNGHIRAQLGPSSISWGAWNNPGSPNTASEWQGPLGTGNSSASTKTPWGNSIGISSGGFIHHFSVTMDQEVDCNVGRSTNADTAATWTNGFGTNTSPTGKTGTSPPWTVAVIDKSMTFECKALAFAPLASDVMLAVYSNGAVAQPNLTNLRFVRSGTAGTWTNVPVSGGTGANVFSGGVTINQNDWALVPVTQSAVYAFRKNGNAIEGRSYSTAGNSWATLSPQPPAFTTGQTFKAGAGLFGATDGTSVWLFVVNTDAANSILYTKLSAGAWTAWATVPGTGTGTQTRNFIAGYQTPGAGQIGLVWTQGTTNFDVMTTALNTSGGSGPSPTATVTAPASGSTASGVVEVTATATPISGSIAGVQFVLDGVNLGAEDTTSPYSISWDTLATPNGTHFLSAIARESTGATGAASAVTVNVLNDLTAPSVIMTTPANGATVSTSSIFLAAHATDDVGVAGVQFLLDGAPLGAEVTAAPYTVTWNPGAVAAGVHTLAARARDAAGRQTTSTAVSITKVKITPVITWPSPANIVYGTALGPQLNATTTVPGAFAYSPAAGIVLPAGANQTLSTTFTPTDTTNYTTATAARAITVIDTTPPTLTVPPSATLEATGPAGASLAYSTSASDPVDGNLPVSCVPAGPTFPLGSTTVTCSATDLSGLMTVASFLVTVLDTIPPAVTPPAPISVPATEYFGARGNVAGSDGSQLLAALLAGGSATDVRDAAPLRLPPLAVIDGSTSEVTVNTLFPIGSTTVTFRFQDSTGHIGSAQAVVTVTARIVDEPTMISTVAMGGGRLHGLQNPDGGWVFKVGAAGCGGPYGSCANTFGIIALGLVATDKRTGGTARQAAAIAAGDALIARYQAAIAQNPQQLPFNQDIEFLVELSALTGNQLYATTALSWFQVTIDRYPNAAARIDALFATRDASRLRSLAAWDAASFIRAAKSIGRADYALAAANRVRDLEPIWKDTNPAHRFDQCGVSAGCGPADNPMAFDYTILGEGSMLWAIHDLPGFDVQIAEYRSFLLAQQGADGSWDVGNSQITSYVTIGLSVVGGAEPAIRAAAHFFLVNQLPSGGWPFSAGGTSEYSAVNAEVVRAISTLFSTKAGANVAVTPAQLSSVTFSNVSNSGMTTVVAIDPGTVSSVSGGFDVVGGLTYQVNTTAAISGDIVVCFSVPWVTDTVAFDAVRILHGESGVLVDRTILAPDQPAPDFATRRVCARTTSLSPFAVALARPDATPPVLTVPAGVTIEAVSALGSPVSFTAQATDDLDEAVAVTCTPASGSTFALGTTAVICGATDASGNAAIPVVFNVHVTDTTPPAVTVPADVTIAVKAAVHTFSASAADLVDGSVTPVCSPPSGSRFALGSTTVTCRATDARGNVGVGTFVVTVTARPPRNRAPVAFDDRYQLKPGAMLTGFLKATDADGDRLRFEVVARDLKGTVVVDEWTGAFTYTPPRRAADDERFTFRVFDGRRWSDTAKIRVTLAKEDRGRDRQSR